MTEERKTLRIGDLKRRLHPAPKQLMNMKIPAAMAAAIDQLAKRLGVTKTDVVIALLNEGLAVAQKKTSAS
jgi:hypothetical protein